MRVRMLETRRGSLDGLTVQPFEKGQVYDLSQTEMTRSLAGIFLRAGWAEEVKVRPPEPERAAAEPPAAAPEAAPGPMPAVAAPEQAAEAPRPSRRRRGG